MILLFHALHILTTYLLSYIVKSAKAQCKLEGSDEYIGESEDRPLTLVDEELGIRFVPPLYVRRYTRIADVLKDERWIGKIKKVVDFGCAELGLFVFLKRVPGIHEVIEVDIDRDILERFCCKAAPITSDYLNQRTEPLRVQVLAGSVAELDPRLSEADAVICIELIEHLHPHELEALPHTIFAFIRPFLAIFTTPNSEFNVLFPLLRGFRHPDHKFEWTRQQFQRWAHRIVREYPSYTVTFHGLGSPPVGYKKDVGYCTQMAVFQRKDSAAHEGENYEVVPEAVYQTVRDYDYPFRVDNRSDEEKILSQAEYYIRVFAVDLDSGDTFIPLHKLLPMVSNWCNSEIELRVILEAANWEICLNESGCACVVYPHYQQPTTDSEDDQSEIISSSDAEGDSREGTASVESEVEWAETGEDWNVDTRNQSTAVEDYTWCVPAENQAVTPVDWLEEASYPHRDSSQDASLHTSCSQEATRKTSTNQEHKRGGKGGAVLRIQEKLAPAVQDVGWEAGGRKLICETSSPPLSCTSGAHVFGDHSSSVKVNGNASTCVVNFLLLHWNSKLESVFLNYVAKECNLMKSEGVVDAVLYKTLFPKFEETKDINKKISRYLEFIHSYVTSISNAQIDVVKSILTNSNKSAILQPTCHNLRKFQELCKESEIQYFSDFFTGEEILGNGSVSEMGAVASSDDTGNGAGKDLLAQNCADDKSDEDELEKFESFVNCTIRSLSDCAKLVETDSVHDSDEETAKGRQEKLCIAKAEQDNIPTSSSPVVKTIFRNLASRPSDDLDSSVSVSGSASAGEEANDRAIDSGYHNSSSIPDLTLEHVDDLSTETEDGATAERVELLKHSSSSSDNDDDNDGDVWQPALPLNAPIWDVAQVENGDVANNNRDGEGNNVAPLPPPVILDGFIQPIEDLDNNDNEIDVNILPEFAFPDWLLHLVAVANNGAGDLRNILNPQAGYLQLPPNEGAAAVVQVEERNSSSSSNSVGSDRASVGDLEEIEDEVAELDDIGGGGEPDTFRTS